MENLAQEIARSLLQINAIKLSPQKPFTWASGIQSPIYCDNRIALSYPAVRNQIVHGFAQLAQSMDFDAVAGVATAGIPWGALLADRLSLPFLYVRSKPKEHGRQNRIEGMLEEGQKILVTEDLISTGGSSLQAVDALREQGAEVISILAIFSYQFDEARQAFKDQNCNHQTLSNYTALLSVANELNYINAADLTALQKWSTNPRAWQISDEV
ncbi:MAG: orotate phosphoribosyltransferase [Lewinellaceae bacterium]|nr:orotate phosphoribosyltransferase [Lewinellaceae bacterium]